MSWHGIGLISGNWAPLSGMGSLTGNLPILLPGPQWTGTSGSGFATVPVDPQRITAKPALRLITPPNQHFTDTLAVGVIAMANDGGTLATGFGIESITFHYEGRTLTVTEPGWHTLMTERGPRTYFGWWARLRRPPGLSGKAHLYVEARARDATMQPRILGPLNFSPVASEYDLDLEINPDLPEIAGRRYKSFWPAISYARSQFPHNPRFLITRPGKYEIERNPANNGEAPTDQYAITGRYTIEASVPGVSIGRLGYDNDALALIPGHRTWWRIKGANITYDTRHVRYLSAVTNLPDPAHLVGHWLDGVTVTTSDPDGKNELFRGGTTPRSSQVVFGNPIYTECHFINQNTPATKAMLIRGCMVENSSQDIISNALCVVQSTFAGGDQDFWNGDALAFTVTIPAGDTLAREGGNSSSGINGGLWTAVVSGTTYTFDVGNGSEAYYLRAPAGGYNGVSGIGGYWCRDVVDWLNTLPGWSATLSPEFAAKDRVAAYLSRPGLKGQGFDGTPHPVITGTGQPEQIVWTADTHGDWYQHTSGKLENVIVAFNRVWNVEAQLIFLAPILANGTAASRDIFFVGNAMAIDPIGKLYYDPLAASSQFSRPHPMSHVVIAHNTLANQGLILNTITGNITDGGYNLIRNNAMRSLRWTGAPMAGMVIDGLLLHEGAAVPLSISNYRVAGNQNTLYAGFAAGDFTPTALMREKGLVPAIAVDAGQTPFPDPCAPGAIAAEADELLVVAPPPTGGTGLSAAGLALSNLLAGKPTSGMWDYRQATNPGLWSTANISGGAGPAAQGIATRQPVIDPVTGALFDNTDQIDAATASDIYSVFMLVRKAAGSTSGQLLRNLVIYQDGSNTTFTSAVAVDGTGTLRRRDLYTALNDAAWHRVSAEGLTLTGILQVGRDTGGMIGNVMLVVALRHSEFATNLATAKTAALAWLAEQQP